MENYKSVVEIANEWGMTPRGVRTLCQNGKIEGASKLGNVWAIPSSVTRPIDGRETTGKYKNWRNSRRKENGIN